jgi:N utilization substance protein B
MRELAFKIVYELEVKGEAPEKVLELCFEHEKLDNKAKKFISERVLGVWENKEKFESEIKTRARTWSYDRLSKIAISAIKIGLWELLFNEKITPAIAISEAVNLASKYDEKEQADFTNGVLGEFLKEKEGE